LVDDRLKEYIKSTLEKGYDEDVIKKAVEDSGYTHEDFNEALKELILNKGYNAYSVDLPWKKATVLIYTLISLTLGLFAIEFIGLIISKIPLLDYILLGFFCFVWAVFSYITLKKVEDNWLLNLGYIVPLGIIIDVWINKRVPLKIALPIILFFYMLTFFAAQSGIFSRQEK
jgi:hypothetical protein